MGDHIVDLALHAEPALALPGSWDGVLQNIDLGDAYRENPLYRHMPGALL